MSQATSQKFFVTTPIYYVNAAPHLGTFYTTVVADALARFHRAHDPHSTTFFVTGLDEHGQKIERLANSLNTDPQVFCDDVAQKFQTAWNNAGISNDDFIRTTSARHKKSVYEMWRRMFDAGDIYLGEYDGLYCVGCEDSKSEDEATLINEIKCCPVHRTPLDTVKEKNYFFRLSKYQKQLEKLYCDRPEFIRPESRLNEVKSFVAGGLRDLSVSRTSVKWGICVPEQPEHTIYVWIDALTNYLTVLGGPYKVASDPDAAALWANSVHLIAKDILRFHAVYWPAMLMSAGLPVPKAIFCHGYLTVRGQKISKSLPATRVDPSMISAGIGADPLRYFVLREYAFGSDGDFTYESLFARFSSDLGNDLGNLLNRTVSIARKNLGEFLPPANGDGVSAAGAAIAEAQTAVVESTKHWSSWVDFSPARALEATWRMIRAANAFIENAAPWKLAKDGNTQDLAAVLSVACELIRRAAMLVGPAMPTASREILRQIGRTEDVGGWPTLTWDGWPGGTLTEPIPVFPRIDPDKQAELTSRWMAESSTK